jgi:antitoxin MazE
VVLVSRWGNSLAVRIPADVARALGLKEGDSIDLRPAKDGAIEIVTEEERRRQALAALRKFRGRMPADFKFDREEANAR